MAVCIWCQEDCGGTCLRLRGSTQMKPGDPAYSLLTDGVTSTPKVYRDYCYICRDPEYAQMGLPLCQPCPECTADPNREDGHIPADDEECDDCGFNAREAYYDHLEKTYPEQEGKNNHEE